VLFLSLSVSLFLCFRYNQFCNCYCAIQLVLVGFSLLFTRMGPQLYPGQLPACFVSYS